MLPPNGLLLLQLGRQLVLRSPLLAIPTHNSRRSTLSIDRHDHDHDQDTENSSSMSHRPLIRRLRPYIQHRRPDVARKFQYFDNWYPTTPVDKLTPAMDPNVKVTAKPYQAISMYDREPGARLRIVGERVTRLFKFERIELPRYQAYEARLIAERLIIEAMRHGDRHRLTMETADFWLHEKALVHKLFKVLVPRYVEFSRAFTSIYFLAPKYEAAALGKVHWKERVAMRSSAFPSYDPYGAQFERAVLELRGNPLPPIRVPPPKNANILTNVLMSAAREDAYRRANHSGQPFDSGEERSDSAHDGGDDSRQTPPTPPLHVPQ